MKPRLTLTPGIPGYSKPQWWCIGDGAFGIGDTAKAAYTVWVESRMQRLNGPWFQQPPPRKLGRFERWVMKFGEWR